MRTISFELKGLPCSFDIKPPGDTTIPSLFLLGLPKAGSTLLNHLMKPIVRSAGLEWVAVQEILYAMGVPNLVIPAEVNDAFMPFGYAFGGFRSLPGSFRLPPYASGHSILLVRDPRDMLTSLYFSVAHSHRPPGDRIGGEMAEQFHKRRQEVSRMGIDAFALANASAIVGQYRTIGAKLAGIDHKLYRYEDVVFDKLGFVQDMLAYLRLAVRPAIVNRVVAANDIRPDVEDVARHIRKVSPGDHREKLRPQTVAQLDGIFAEILRRYAY
jgi:hypothetical protein